MYRWLLAALCATLPCLAAAQMIYKVLMPDGSVLFTDTPPPGAKILEEREAKSTPRAATPGRLTPIVPSTVAPGIGHDGMPVTSASRKPSAIDAATTEVNEAERAVKAAREKLELGREPLPGERLGLKGGGSRLSPDYEARIAGLERDVASAEARLQRAYLARNAAR